MNFVCWYAYGFNNSYYSFLVPFVTFKNVFDIYLRLSKTKFALVIIKDLL